MKPKAYSYIRFSTPDQEEGDSKNRQLSASRKYAQEHDLDLDESMQDLGLSAYRGKHKMKGHLGIFLQLIKDDKIPSGTVLIVENLDRLSREQPYTALSQLMGIVQAGIKLVTLKPFREITPDNINEGQLYDIVGEIIRSNKESERKSSVLSDAWKSKRDNISTIKLTAKCPLWLKPNFVKMSPKKHVVTGFEPVSEEACQAIYDIFDLMDKGKGMGWIERELNSRNGWSPKNGWRKSYIAKILNNKAVIGEFTPHRLTDKGRLPISIFKEYYPPIISDELFYKVQEQISRKGDDKKSGYSGGQTGAAHNLFVHVIRCGLCKSPMHYIDKGHTWQYLQCDTARRRKTCSAKSVSYAEFEHLFFDNFEELNITDLLPDKVEVIEQRTQLQSRLTGNEQHIIELTDQKENLKIAIARTKDDRVSQELDNQLISTLDDVDKLVQINHGIEKELNALKDDLDLLKANIDTAKEVYELFKACEDESAQINLRLKLRVYIRKIVKSIEIYPLQEQYQELEQIEPWVYKIMNSKYIDHVRIRFNGSRKTRTLFLKTYNEDEL